MLVICYGIAKSGSTLTFELVRGILTSAGHSQKRLRHDALKPRSRTNHMATVEKDALAGLIEAIGPDRIVVAKTHKVFDDEDYLWMEEQQRARKLQIITSHRDPRDMCLSLVDHGEKSRNDGRRGFAKVNDIAEAAQVVENAIPKFAKWASLQGSLRLYFETVAFAPDKALDAIEHTIGIKGDHEEAIRHAFEDAFTQRNKAKRNRYEDELSAEQKQELSRTFAQFIARVCVANDDAWFAEFRRQLLDGTGFRRIKVA
jgi:hypothetical protein